MPDRIDLKTLADTFACEDNFWDEKHARCSVTQEVWVSVDEFTPFVISLLVSNDCLFVF